MISYGKVIVDKINVENYTEWTLFGEPVHVAKRIMEIEPHYLHQRVPIYIGSKNAVDKVEEFLKQDEFSN